MCEELEWNLKPCILLIHYRQRTNVQKQQTIKYSVGQFYWRNKWDHLMLSTVDEKQVGKGY